MASDRTFMLSKPAGNLGIRDSLGEQRPNPFPYRSVEWPSGFSHLTVLHIFAGIFRRFAGGI